MDSTAILQRVAWFADLPLADLARLGQRSDTRWYPKGSTLFYEGDPGDYLVVVLKGRVRIALLDADGQETIVRDLGPLEVMGELSLLDGQPRSATAIAVERTQVLRVARAAFLSLLQSRPSFALSVLIRMAADLRRATEQIRTLSLADLRGQVVRCHLQIALERGLPVGGAVTLRPRPPRFEIARRIGCRPESVSRAMRELIDGRFISLTKGGVSIEARATRRYWPSLQPSALTSTPSPAAVSPSLLVPS